MTDIVNLIIYGSFLASGHGISGIMLSCVMVIDDAGAENHALFHAGRFVSAKFV